MYEKEAVQKTASDLRSTVKKLEAEKVDNGRAIQDLRQRIARAFYLHQVSLIFFNSDMSIIFGALPGGLITVSTVVLNCCKGDKPSQWETPIFGPL